MQWNTSIKLVFLSLFQGAWRIDNGAQSISEVLVAKLENKVLLNHQVQSIVQNESLVTVSCTNGVNFVGKYGIGTIPVFSLN